MQMWSPLQERYSGFGKGSEKSNQYDWGKEQLLCEIGKAILLS